MNNPDLGARIAFRKTLTHAEQAFFTGISGNLGPLYVDAVRARAEGLSGPASFELILGALASACINRLGGPSRRIAAMSLRFLAPVPLSSTVEVVAELIGLDPFRLRLIGTLDGSGTVMEGEADLVQIRTAA